MLTFSQDRAAKPAECLSIATKPSKDKTVKILFILGGFLCQSFFFLGIASIKLEACNQHCRVHSFVLTAFPFCDLAYIHKLGQCPADYKGTGQIICLPQLTNNSIVSSDFQGTPIHQIYEKVRECR
ncbi:uncharacterized protein [Triticum aestivum]|uniref:uncharacterized protein isoform X2 n=1 Tax=Triticum aestivum TaxID=4565 RepID=UPI001D01AA37|nr:uncharacterized protein LOC123087502 isoform X2 [Triticum aestivum]